MESIKKRLIAAREHRGMDIRTAASVMEVAIEELLSWENGEEVPTIRQLIRITDTYGVTNDWLLTGNLPSSKVMHVTENLSNRLFDENRMYTSIRDFCRKQNFEQTEKALIFADEKHRGQFRKERKGERVPYIYHPMLMTCHAISLGLTEDDLLAATLLHDVCEDCGVLPEELPVGRVVKEAVSCLTKPGDYKKTDEYQRRYYDGIEGNRIAMVVKLLDRCQNVSGMAGCFGDDQMAAYIMETETYLYPLYERARILYPEYDFQLFLIKYHLSSVIETIRHYMKEKCIC